jgi:hypothetical protein
MYLILHPTKFSCSFKKNTAGKHFFANGAPEVLPKADRAAQV